MNIPVSTNKFPELIKNFSPAWFAAVMGTGIFAVTSKYYAYYWLWLNNAAVFLWIINIIFFLVLIVPWTLRWLIFYDHALKDLKDPVKGQFYATLPIACLVMAADFLLLGSDYIGASLVMKIAQGLWIAGVVLSLGTAFIIPILNVLNKLTIEDINPAWFMPPVSLIVVPTAGAKLIPYWPQAFQRSLLILNYVSWGSGFFLFMLIAVICIYRFFVAPPLPGSLIPTIWIYLGPIGAGTMSILNLGSVSAPFLGSMVTPVLNLFALLYWCFGFWWLITAGVITIIYIHKKNLPYALSWWAFTFPLGAYTGATYLISIIVQSEAVRLFGFLCYWLLAFCWLMVFSHTIIHIIGPGTKGTIMSGDDTLQGRVSPKTQS
ncbi:tellurite resistance protein-like permease [Desulfosporosinus orientis DSM 765]|uniref:Tellurite resistance protein-like permease n=1 Tax=Desulfosporosinus orientis (strain ATCC 19365 / DSM 765 / NCIMB 8382 / VKM B-1628 / Singapore I) TaxID=768706 RepID=G7WCZ6_DESOD|nr:C4-dicarboxylate ABC transporter [Desulfosporosinus orientis]AET67191.1 tellurite resistance protein-like permease [Desulfosporosinus orientis DSM 765]